MIKCHNRRLKVIWKIRFYAEFFFFALIDLQKQKETQCQLFHQSLTLLATDSFERWMEPPETRFKWVTSNLVLAPRKVRFYLKHTILTKWGKLCAPFQKPTTSCKDWEKPSENWLSHMAFAVRRNQTQAICAASKCTIHYTIPQMPQSMCLVF